MGDQLERYIELEESKQAERKAIRKPSACCPFHGNGHGRRAKTDCKDLHYLTFVRSERGPSASKECPKNYATSKQIAHCTSPLMRLSPWRSEHRASCRGLRLLRVGA